MRDKDWLFTAEGKAYLLDEYARRQRSTYDIAADRGTYANMVRRALQAHGIPLRSRQEAQLAALKSGRHAHPTRGRARTGGEREAISEGLAQAWRDMPADEKARRVALAKARWDAMPAGEKARLLGLANEGVRRAAAGGSQLERHLLAGLAEAGLQVEYHTRGADILLPGPKVAVCVDGPTHFLPIWGDEQLEKTVAADARRNATLAADGFRVVVLKCLTKTLSDRQKRDALDRVLAEAAAGTAQLVELEVN